MSRGRHEGRVKAAGVGKENKASAFTKADFALAIEALNKNASSTEDFACLFGVSSENSKSTNVLRNGWNMRQQRQLLKLCFRQKTSKVIPCFVGLQDLLNGIVEEQTFIPEAAFGDDEDENESIDATIALDVKSRDTLQFLFWAATCLRETFSSSKRTIDYSDAWGSVISLHEILDLIDPDWGDEAAAAQTIIVALCETIWLHDMPDREHVIVKALPPLVEAACHSKTDLKRLYNIREALQIIDLESKESKPFASLLLRVASSPACLKVSEGKKFLAYLFHVGLRAETHQSIRIQIPENKRSVLMDYGEIYFLAWKQSPDDDSRIEFETEVLQDLMYSVIHASKPRLVKALLTVLKRFHEHKNQTSVEDLLHRLYSPLIWRSLASVHAFVRENAVRLFGDIFPLRGSETSSNILEKGINALRKSLQDPNPKVRVAASISVSSILQVYWDVIPAQEIRYMLDLLLAHHASDTTSAAVRIAAINAFTEILDCSHSHPVLRNVLLPIGNLLHDRTERVRLAVVLLLLRIKKEPFIKYYHVVPLEHLMARLAAETNPMGPVALHLTKLMANSYCPASADPVKLLERTLLLLTKYPASAAAFYSNLRQCREPDFLCQLVVYLFQYLDTAVKEAKQSPANGKKRQRIGKAQNETTSRTKVSLSTMAALAETISILWGSIDKDLAGSEEWAVYLTEQIQVDMLSDMLAFFDDQNCSGDAQEENRRPEEHLDESDRCLIAIMEWIRRLPRDSIEDLIPTVERMFFDSTKVPSREHISLLISWDVGKVSILANAIRSGFAQVCFVTEIRSRGKRRSKSSSSGDAQKMRPSRALIVLDGVLRGGEFEMPTTRDIVIESKSLQSAVWEGIQNVDTFLSSDLPSVTEPIFFIQLVNLYGRFLLHKEAAVNKFPAVWGSEIEALFDWITKIVSQSCQQRDIEVPFNDLDMSAIPFEQSFLTSPATRSSTRRSEGSTSPDDKRAFPTGTDVTIDKQKFSVSLVVEAGALCSAWLSVTATNAQHVSEWAQRWCSAAPYTALLPLYTYLAVQIARLCPNFELLLQILKLYSETKLDDDSLIVLRRTFGTVLGGARRRNQLPVLVGMVLDVAQEMVMRLNESTVVLPDSLEGLWHSDEGSISLALEGVFGNEKASRELLGQVSSRLRIPHSDKRFQLFLVQCLWLLCDKNSKVTNEALTEAKGADKSTLSEEAADLLSSFQQPE